MSVYTLALESSCDETSAAVLKDGRTVLSNVISSQVPIHRKFGGVVPEIASRHHIEQVWDADYVTLNILLPVGISFYTFQALSYTIDVYQGKIKATHDIVAFFGWRRTP